MDKSLIFFAVAFVGCAQFAAGSRVRCLECSRMTKPEDCKKDVLCDEIEICHTEKYITDLGHILYDTGCKLTSSCAALGYKRPHDAFQPNLALTGRKRQNIAAHVCEQCCDTDLCNMHLCGGKDTGKLECATCVGLQNMSYCTQLDFCEPDEVCFIEKKLTDTFEQLYDAGCVKKSQCDAKHNSKRQYDNVVDLCFNCCNTSSCNYECHRAPTPAVTTPTAITNTPTTTTTTTTTTTPTTTTTTTTTTTPTTTTPTTTPTTTTPTTTPTTTTPTTTPTTTTPTTTPTTTTPTTTPTTAPTTPTSSTITTTSTTTTAPLPSSVCPTFPPMATKQPPKSLSNVLASIGCSGMNEVVLLVDDSQAVTDEDEHHFEMFSRVFAATLDIGPNRTRMGYTYYGEKSRDIINLHRGDDRDYINAHMAYAERKYGTAAGDAKLGNALLRVNRVVFSKRHERPGAKKYLVILSESNVYHMDMAIAEAKQLKDRGIEIIFIGIGDFRGLTRDLEKVVTSPHQSHLITVDSVEDLGYSLEDIFVSRCWGHTPTVAPDPCAGPKLLNYLGCGAKEDIVLILDHSGSITDPGWKKMAEFTHKLVDHFNVSQGTTRIGLMIFNNEQKPLIQLGNSLSKADLLNEIDAKLGGVRVEGDTFTNLALDRTLHLFRHEQRQDAMKVAIIFTDGGSHKKFETFSTAMDLHRDNVTVFVVGIGTEIDLYEQMILASDPDAEHMLNVQDYHNLIRYLDYLIAVRCRDMAISTTPVHPSTTNRRT